MANYRADIIGTHGRPVLHANLIAGDDNDARESVERLFPCRLVELYEADRLVGRLGTTPSQDLIEAKTRQSGEDAVSMYR